MNRPVARYSTSRRYLAFALAALAGTGFSIWSAQHWPSTWVAAALFGATTAAILSMICRPAIEIYETHLRVGKRVIFWNEIRRLDRTRWMAPLVLRLSLMTNQTVSLIYPGDFDSSTSLLRHLRRYSKEALLDGIPYRQFWGETLSSTEKQIPAAHYPLLRPEDEEEVERMFQRLRSVGHLEQDDKSTSRGSDK